MSIIRRRISKKGQAGHFCEEDVSENSVIKEENQDTTNFYEGSAGEEQEEEEHQSVNEETQYHGPALTSSGRPSSAGKRRMCPYGCSRLLSVRTIDMHRNMGCRSLAEDDRSLRTPNRKQLFCCGVCYEEFVTRQLFVYHLKREHDMHPTIYNMTFPDREIYQRFIRWIEIEGGAHFRHKSGAKKRSNGRGIFMSCNRSGCVKLPGDSEAQKERVGPVRSGFSCTAFVHGVMYDDGQVKIEFCPDHYGHDARMRLPNVIKYIIARKQIEGVSNVDIAQYLKSHFSRLAYTNVMAQRVCLVDAEELRSFQATTTKKWEQNGMPTNFEIWEEELLDSAGIVPPYSKRILPPNSPTTAQIAAQKRWPIPRCFIAKIRDCDTGDFVDLDQVTTMRDRVAASHNDAIEEENELTDEDEFYDVHVSFDEKTGEIDVDGDEHIIVEEVEIPAEERAGSADVIDVAGYAESEENNRTHAVKEEGTKAEKSQEPGRQSIVLNGIHMELNEIRRLTMYPSQSTTLLADCLTKLQMIRTSLCGKSSPYQQRGTQVERRSHRVSAPAIKRIRRSENVKMEVASDHFSDDEDIVVSGGLQDFNSHLWS